MDTQDIRTRWPELREKIKKEHPHLTEDDLLYEIGKEEELLIRLQEKMKKTKKEITDWLHLMG